MFTMTSRAAAALAENRARIGLDDSTPIRISPSESGNGSSANYQLRFASRPAPHDVVTESAGTTVYMAADLVEPLKTTVLDVKSTPQGTTLVLKRRPSR